MKRQPFYEVLADAYLFPSVLKSSLPNILEEPVLQWCAHELLRANGYRVLLTLGIKGCYVFFQNKDTERFFKSRTESTAKVS